MSIYIMHVGNVTSYGIPFAIGQLVTLFAHWSLITAVILLFYSAIVFKHSHIENLPIIDIMEDAFHVYLNT